MKINTKNLVSITEANQNFSKVARLVDEQGSAVILKNNNTKYVLIKYSDFEAEQNSDDETITEISQRIIEQNKKLTRNSQNKKLPTYHKLKQSRKPQLPEYLAYENKQILSS